MLKNLLSVLVFSSFSISLFGQNGILTGIVIDKENKEPISSASVRYEKGKGTITDASGKFHLNLPDGEYFLTVSFIGYKNETVKVMLAEGDPKDLKIELKPSAIQINQIEVGSQYKKNAAKETVSAAVISKSQIQNTNSNDLGEIVSKTSGVTVQDGQISIRGGSGYSYGIGSRTAVLSDGLSLTSADLGEGQNKMAAVENVKQVEVIKGASSVIYGSSALNGVVNIVTEWPTGVDPKTEIETNFGIYDNPKLKYQKWWGGGQPFSGILNVNHQRRIGKNLQFIAGGNITGINSFLQFANEFRVRGFFKMRYLHPKIEGLNFGLNGSVMYETSGRFFLSKNLDSAAYVYGAGSDDKYTRTTIEPFVSYNSPKGHRGTLNWRYMNIFRKGNGTDPNAVSHQLITDNQYQYRLKGMFVLTAGVPFTLGWSSSNLYKGKRSNFNAAIYTQLEFNYKFLSLQGGVRYEVIGVDTFIEKGRPVARFGLNIQAAKATFIRASWGQGYRIPSIGERFIAQEFVNGILIIPNDTLKAERGWSLEVGLKQGFRIKKWAAYIDAAFFWQEYKNYVEYQLALYDNKYSNGQQIFPDSLESPFKKGSILGLKALNVENARVAGYEIGIAGTGTIGKVGLQLAAGYTYTWPGFNPRDSSGKQTYSTKDFLTDMFKYNFSKVTDPLTLSRMLNYRSRHLFRADIELSYWKCYLGTTLTYGTVPEKVPAIYTQISAVLFQDKNAVNDYLVKHAKGDFIMDIRAGIRLNERIKIGFIVKNATNLYYSLRPGKPEQLRSYTIQFRYTF